MNKEKYIYITQHAIDRFKERCEDTTKPIRAIVDILQNNKWVRVEGDRYKVFGMFWIIREEENQYVVVTVHKKSKTESYGIVKRKTKSGYRKKLLKEKVFTQEFEEMMAY